MGLRREQRLPGCAAADSSCLTKRLRRALVFEDAGIECIIMYHNVSNRFDPLLYFLEIMNAMIPPGAGTKEAE